ncbi:MAG: transcriptional regulator [Desulfobacteraceae bacterium]|nr:MAG: transcriptional regulator [Desulfobacteraceae bacterium]
MQMATRNKKDTCEVFSINQKKVDAVRKVMQTDGVIKKLAQTFKVLGDPTRTQILYALAQDELCVCDLACLLGKTQSAVSHQLRVLRNLDLVKYRKEGKIAYYSLDDIHIRNLFAEGLEHVRNP